MNRRRFLLISGGGLLVAGSGGWLWWISQHDAGPATADVHVDRLAQAMSGVAVVGRAWLSANEGVDPRAGLIDHLELDPEQEIDQEAFVQSLASQVEKELGGDGIFVHEGWWLSETEARLAAVHVVLLGDRASEPAEPGFEQAREGRLLRIQDQNPRSYIPGEGLSHPGLPDNVVSFRTETRPANRLVFVVEGQRRSINPRANGFSVVFNDAILAAVAAAGEEVDLWLYDPVAQRRQKVGKLEVKGVEAGEQSFCAPIDWGERSTRAGQAFNEQPDGSAAFWVRIDCFPENTVAVFNDVELPTTLRPDDGLITARVPDPTLYASPGRLRLELLDRASGESVLVGEFVVE
jgi:hypothetical protein